MPKVSKLGNNEYTNSVREYWSNGVMECWKLATGNSSSTPILHYSNTHSKIPPPSLLAAEG
jgi:hypothetical protein